MSGKIRIAIVGYGKIAQDQHVPSIAGNDRFELVATVSRSGGAPEGVRFMKKNFPWIPFGKRFITIARSRRCGRRYGATRE